MGAGPSSCVVVEDSQAGVTAARRAGMRALAFAGGVTSAAQLAGRNAVVFETMAEMPRSLAGLAA